jgi:hypothetical protein
MKIVFLCISFFASLAVHCAAVRCVDAAGSVVGYADTAVNCPSGSRLKGEVAAMPAVQAGDVKAAQAQAARDQLAAAALDSKQSMVARASSKAQQDSNSKNSKQLKQCKAAEGALQRAKSRLDDTPTSSSSISKAKKDSKTKTHTVVRDSDTKAGKARKKAQKTVDAAQIKRDLACA